MEYFRNISSTPSSWWNSPRPQGHSVPVTNTSVNPQIIRSVSQISPERVILPERIPLETKGFLNSKVVEARIEQAIIDNKDPCKLPSEIAEVMYTVVDEQKWDREFSHIAKPLPVWTVWSDICFHITRWEQKSAQVFVKVYLNNKFFDTITYSDIHLKNKNGTVPNSWIILCLLGLQQKFSWFSNVAPDSIRKAKWRLSKSLQEFMGMESEPFLFSKSKKEYCLAMKIIVEPSVAEKFQSYDWFRSGQAINQMLEKDIN